MAPAVFVARLPTLPWPVSSCYAAAAFLRRRYSLDEQAKPFALLRRKILALHAAHQRVDERPLRGGEDVCAPQKFIGEQRGGALGNQSPFVGSETQQLFGFWTTGLNHRESASALPQGQAARR